MDTKFEFAPETEDKIVYVRPVSTGDLPDEVRAQVGEIDTVYAVHSAQGAPLAIVKDRQLAFSLARQHDFAPVNVH